MENQQAKKPTFKPWYEWEMPPLWVLAVAGLVLIGISTMVFMKIGESMSPGTAAVAAPASAASGASAVNVAHD